MSVLEDMRNDLADDLTTAGLEVVAYIPDDVNPPITVFEFATPYLEPAAVFGEYQISLTVRVVLEQSDNLTATVAFDDNVIIALNAIAGTDWEFVAVNPEIYFPQGRYPDAIGYLSAAIQIVNEINIGE